MYEYIPSAPGSQVVFNVTVFVKLCLPDGEVRFLVGRVVVSPFLSREKVLVPFFRRAVCDTNSFDGITLDLFLDFKVFLFSLVLG